MSIQSEKVYDVLDCSEKGSNLLPNLVFTVLRNIEPYLQYLIIFRGYGHQIISNVGVPTIPAGPKGTVLVAMAATCAIKESINIITHREDEQMTCSIAIIAGIISTIPISTNTLATLSSLIYGPSEDLGTLQYIGISMFTVGILTTMISELQSKRFHADPKNKDKLYSGGLFSLARHIDRGGDTLWRTGLALTSGNYWLAAIHFYWRICDFTTRVGPHLKQYYSKKYGEDWQKFEHDVPSILFPYVW